MAGRRGVNCKDFDEGKRTKLFYDVIDKIDPMQRAEFVRKLGFQEHTLRERLNKDIPDWIAILNLWRLGAGGLDNERLEVILSQVRREIVEGKRSDETDELFRKLNKDSLLNARLVAWFIYDFIEHHSDSDWDRIVHLKLKLRKGKSSAIRRNNSGNFDEQRYQEVWQWKRKNNIETVQQMAVKMHEAELQLPEQYGLYLPTPPDSDQTAGIESAATQTDQSHFASSQESVASGGPSPEASNLAGAFAPLSLSDAPRAISEEGVRHGKKLKVVVSYSWSRGGEKIYELSRKIAEQLKRRDFQVWIDIDHNQHNLSTEEVDDAVRDCDVLIVCTSQQYEEECRDWKRELIVAAEHSKNVVFANVEENYRTSSWLAQKHLMQTPFYDFTEYDFESEIERLAQELTKLGRPEQPEPLVELSQNCPQYFEPTDH